jgi:hypothetical protein
MSERGKKLSGALRNDPKNKPTERLSPGVYRSAGGGLVTKGGRQIQRPTQAPPAQSQRPMDTSFVGVNQATPEQLRDFANRYNNGAGSRIGEIAGNVAVDPGSRAPDSFIGMLNPGASAPQFDPNNPNSYQPYPGQIQNGLGQSMTMPQMPQASANQGGRYRLSPGVYGTQQQAMNQYNQQMQQFNASLPAQLMKKY